MADMSVMASVNLTFLDLSVRQDELHKVASENRDHLHTDTKRPANFNGIPSISFFSDLWVRGKAKTRRIWGYNYR